MMSDSILASVFEMLLGSASDPDQLLKVNDYTVEGATVLMNKIGNIFDNKLDNLRTKA